MFLIGALATSNQFEIGDYTKILQHIVVLSLERLVIYLSQIVQAATITEPNPLSWNLENSLLSVLVTQ